jgi:hypothetical protein
MSREKCANHLRNAVAFVRWAGELANDAKIDAGIGKRWIAQRRC